MIIVQMMKNEKEKKMNGLRKYKKAMKDEIEKSV